MSGFGEFGVLGFGEFVRIWGKDEYVVFLSYIYLKYRMFSMVILADRLIFIGFGKFVRIWEICQDLGNLSGFGKFVRIWGICPDLGNLSGFGKFVRIWGICPDLGKR